MTKKDIYAEYHIEYKAGKIHAPLYGWIAPLLVNGNAKLGRGVWTWSTLPTNKTFEIDGETVSGTCPCNCSGCYATKGNYNFSSVKKSLAMKTVLSYQHLHFVYRAISAQIKADNVKIVRIHAAGDFPNDAYIAMWQDIALENPDTIFWTYTKNKAAENAFDDIENANVVKSVIPGHGFNFGHCDYILDIYSALSSAGESVYICRCGIDNNQHCINCKGCMKHKFVLFVEHSTEYKAEADPLFPELAKIVESQKSMEG